MTHHLESTLTSIANYFHLGDVQSYERRGGTNDNYAVETTTGSYIFKIIVNTTLADIEQSLPYLQWLQQAGFSATAYYLPTPDGSYIYQQDDVVAVVLTQLPGEPPELSEQVCREVGPALAQLHLIPVDGLPTKSSWIDNTYLSGAIAELRQNVEPHLITGTLEAYEQLRHFQPAAFSQSVMHGDLCPSNCLFVGATLSAFLDWQDIAVGATLMDVAMTILGFCFLEGTEPAYHATFQPHLYHCFLSAYEQVRPLSSSERDHLQVAIKYVGLTHSVWMMLRREQYHAGQELVETRTFYWTWGIDTLTLPSL